MRVEEAIMAAQETSRPDQGRDRQTVLVTAASLHGATAEIAVAIGYAAVRLDRVLFRRKRPAGPPGTASGGRP